MQIVVLHIEEIGAEHFIHTYTLANFTDTYIKGFEGHSKEGSLYRGHKIEPTKLC